MAKTPQQRRSKLQEQRIAEEIGGREQPASGSSWSAKGDARKTGELRVEAKFTEKDYYTLKLDDLLKIRDEALKGGAEGWAMQIEFTTYRQRWAVLDFTTWRHMYTFSAGAGCIWYLVDCFAVGKSMRLKASDLYHGRVNALIRHEDYVCEVTFNPELKLDGGTKFAVIDWDEYLRVREAFKP